MLIIINMAVGTESPVCLCNTVLQHEDTRHKNLILFENNWKHTCHIE